MRQDRGASARGLGGGAASPHDASVSPPDVANADPAPGRLLALDRLRGLVMVLMAVDHAGASMDQGHVAADSALMWTPGGELPLAGFLTRWMTHFCAPTFLFLAGTSLALSRANRDASRALGSPADLFQLRRGLFLAALDPTFMTAVWLLAAPPMGILQVLYAIGLGMVAMVVLRRLPAWVLVVVALGYLGAAERIVTGVVGGLTWGAPTWAGLLVQPKFWPNAAVIGGETWPGVNVYPLLPWLAIMMLGHAFGTRLLRLRAEGRSAVPTLVGWGVGALAVFVAVRGANGYGNMLLPREGGSLAQWLHVSKYPPSMSFVAMTLGGMLLALAVLVRREERRPVDAPPPSPDGPLVVFGQTALFFYLAHFVVILGFARLAGLAFALGDEGGGLAAAWWGGLGACALLYLPCRLYRAVKRARPDGLLRYV